MAVKSSDLKLLGGWFSPFASRVKIALNIKGLEYKNIEEDLNSKSDFLLRSNPVHKKIPVLIHGDKPICESLVIVQYIDEVWSNGPSILPRDAYDRTIARFWGSYIDDKVKSTSREVDIRKSLDENLVKSFKLSNGSQFLVCMKNILMAAGDEEEKKRHLEQLEEEVLVTLEEAFNKCSEGKSFFGGNKIGFIDIAFGSFLPFLRVFEEMNGRKILVADKFPELVNWATNFVEDSTVTGTLPEIDKLVLFTTALQEKWAAAKVAAK